MLFFGQGFLTTDSDQANEFFEQAEDAFGKASKEVRRHNTMLMESEM